MVVNLRFAIHHSLIIHVPIAEFGEIAEGEAYQMHDLLSGDRYTWNGSRNYIELDPEQPDRRMSSVCAGATGDGNFA